MRERLIGIDAGGTMTKVALFDTNGNELACEHRPNRMHFPCPGWTERDPEAMWDATCEAIRGVMRKTGTAPGDIAAVTPSGYGAGLYFVDGAGETVRPGLVSTDSRAAELIAGWERFGLRRRIEAQIQSQVWPSQSLPIMAWMQRHEPDAASRTATVLACKDFLRLRLTGERSTDPTDAGCAGIFDNASGGYAFDTMRMAGVEGWIAKLPDIGEPDATAGRLTEAAAAATGLRAGTPVARGVYDVAGCALASGVLTSGQVSVVAGTWSINSTLHSQPITDPLVLIQTPYPVASQYLATSATPTSASNLEWLCKTMLAAEAERARIGGRSIYEVCSDLVAGSLGRETDILFLPYLFGGPNGAPGSLLGLKAGNDLGDVLRAVFEGIVFAHRADIEALLGGRQSARPDTVRLAGGPSKSEVWAQIFADGLGLPVEIANGSEFGAKAAAMCGAVAVGLQPDLATAARHMTRIERRYEPDAGRAEAMSRRYRRYRAVSDGLAAAWAPPPAGEGAAASFAGAPA